MSVEKVEFVLEGGLQQNAHPFKTEALAQADGCYYRSNGCLSPMEQLAAITRGGTSTWGGTSEFPGIANNAFPAWTGMVSTDTDPLYFTSQYAWKAESHNAPATTAFHMAGVTSTTYVTSTDAIGSNTPVMDCSSATNGTVIAEVWTQAGFSGSAIARIYVNIRIASNGSYVLKEFAITGAAGARPKPVFAGNTLFVFYYDGTNISAYRFDTTTLSAITATNMGVLDTLLSGCGFDAQPLANSSTTVLLAYTQTAGAGVQRKIAAVTTAGIVGSVTTWAGDATAIVNSCMSIDGTTQSDVLVAYGRAPIVVGVNTVTVLVARFNFTTPAAPTQIGNVYTVYTDAATPAGFYGFIHQVSIRRYSSTRAKLVFTQANDDTGAPANTAGTVTRVYETLPASASSTAIGLLNWYTLETNLFANPEAGRFVESSGFDPASHMFVCRPMANIADYSASTVIPGMGTAVLFSTEKYGGSGVSGSYTPRQEARFAHGRMSAQSNFFNQITYQVEFTCRSPSGLSNVHVGPDGSTNASLIPVRDTGYVTNCPMWFGFNSITGKRQSATIGKRTLVTGGVPQYWDGRNLTDVGFTGVPRITVAAAAASGVALPVGNYVYSANFEYVDALGDRHTSQAAPDVTSTIAASQSTYVSTSWLPAGFFRDLGVSARTGPRLRVYRTAVNSANPKMLTYELLSQTDNQALNYSVAQTASVMEDAVAQISLGPIQEVSDERLDSVAPPSATMVTVWNGCFALGGTDDDSIWFSSDQEDGLAPFFNEGFRIVIPAGGKVMGICGMDDKLVVFKQNATYVVYGTRPDNTGSGYGLTVQQISGQIGCVNQESVQLGKEGVYFRSLRGLYRVSRGLALEFVGERVADETRTITDDVLDTSTDTTNGLVQFVIESNGPSLKNLLTYDERADAWTRRLNVDAEYAAVRSGQLVLLKSASGSSSGLQIQQLGVYQDVGPVIRTGWKQVGGPQGYYVIRRIGILGEYIGGSHTITADVYANYVLTPIATFTFDSANLVAGEPYQWVMSASSGNSTRVQSLSVRLTFGVSGPTMVPARIASVSLELEQVTNTQQRRTADTMRG